MGEQRDVARREALVRLEQEFGIRGGMVYLLDVVPLVEMLWADGRCQAAEQLLISKYLRDHLERLRELSGGLEVVSPQQVDEFIQRYVMQRPLPGLLSTLRELACSVAFADAGPSTQQRKQALIDYCLDIAAAAVAAYPYGPHERFDEREKRVLRDLVEAVGQL